MGEWASTPDPIEPWDRQPGEGSKAYEHFQTFLDMGADRTLQKVADRASKSEQYIRKLSTTWNWRERTRHWDSMPRRAVVVAYEDMARDIAEQHRELSDKLMKRLSANLDLLPEGADPSVKWSTAQMAAHRGHAFATELTKPESGVKKEISDQIAALLAKLSE